ncbi:SIR2 family protein [Clostridioides sp. ES-W-0016-02]|uniref:SIR2 family protein n=1 Tax=Clostridioides sp. ES-W-0016-02 TaxID=2770788 RepID=UPI001D11B73B|nr:SIR2 family protein [Clostridioides sp. ES-W-0016-02]
MTFEEIMEFNKPYNQKNFDELVNAIKAGYVVPYIGAGMSMLFKDIYPSWSTFLNNTSEEYLEDEDKILFKKIEDYEKKAEFLYEELAKVRFSKHLKKVFGAGYLDAKDKDDFIDKCVYLIPIIFGSGLIITTNYDKVLEKNYGLHNKTVLVSHPGHFEALNNALRNNELVLYKIHGDITEPITSIVLTKEQYEKAYSNDELRKMLTQVYTSKELLFLGCSLEKDRPLELLQQVSEAGMGHYAIIPVSSEKKKHRRIELENEYYTQTIMYPEGKHECVRIILERILQIVLPDEYRRLKDRSLKESRLTNLSCRLTEKWFQNQNDIQIKNLGDRYLPELNVELSLENTFNALGKNEEFKHRFDEKTDKVLSSIKKRKINEVEVDVLVIEEIIQQFYDKTNERLDVKLLKKHFEKISAALDNRINNFKNIIVNEDCEKSKKREDEIYKLKQTQKDIYVYIKYLDSKEIKVVNSPYILLHSAGGMGKSHIIAHTIEKRNMDGHKSILFLGQHFKLDKTPIKHMLEILEIECEFEELLEILNEIGEKEQQRVILFIDALNEGQGKELWKYYLNGIVEQIKKYPWIGLILSIRSEYIPSLIDNNNKLKENLVFIEHQGFSSIEHKAMKKYFDYYGIPYSNIPMPNQEFRNPLFLRIMCETFKGEEINLDTISFTDIYKNYLNILNLRISESCNYSRHANVVTEVLNEMIKYKYGDGLGNNLIPANKCVEIIINIASKYKINNVIIDELIANGIVNKTVNLNDKEYMHVTYEKLEDYLYANLLVKELKEIGVVDFSHKYKYLVEYEDILEVLAIVLSEETGSDIPNEVFEVFKDKETNYNVISAFINALIWRKKSTITEKTLDYINKIVLGKSYYKIDFYNVLILISTKVNHTLNADYIVKYILQNTMADRDAIFIPIFNEIYEEEESSIKRLLGWCFDSKGFDNTSNETIRLSAMMIATFLISSNRNLRDKSTKALVNLLTGKMNIVIDLLKTFEDVDDPYIIERLYAVAFGCVVSEQSEEMIEALAVYVYNKIFDVDYVYPNILLRDYAKNIVDYAKYKIDSSVLKDMDVEPPYKSIFPKVPTDEEIEGYKYDYKASDFKDYYWSQNTILDSMVVEYTRDGQPGWYGDFGRYIFQHYFHKWKGLDYNDLKNIAIKKVFDMGYDVNKHGKFDRTVQNGRLRDSKYERIGKKYQWIALYELAAQAADNYKIEVYTNAYGTKKEIYCKGTFEPDIRNIDPTVMTVINNNNNKKVHNQLFQFSPIPNNEWLGDFSDLPSINDMVNSVYKNQDFLLLNGWYTWKEENDFKNKNYKNPEKDMWVLINSYIIKNDQLEPIVNDLKGKDFMGRWLTEPNSNYTLYNKEYYWADGYYFFQNSYYCGEEWVQIDEHKNILEKDYKVLLPTYSYTTEREGDIFQEDFSDTWHKPCSTLFYELKLRYGQGDSILYNDYGEVVCFESSELLNEDIGFFINKEIFLKYLNEQGYSVFWTMLAEKRVLEEPYMDRKYIQPTISGVYTLNGENRLVGETIESEY